MKQQTLEYLKNKFITYEDIIEEMTKAKTDKQLLLLAHKLVARKQSAEIIYQDIFKLENDVD